MKKVLSVLLIMLTVANVSAQGFTAVTPSGHTLWFSISSSTTVSVYRPTGVSYSLSGSLIIPDSVSYNGTMYAVTYIDAAMGQSWNDFGVFSNQYQLTSVTIPGTVTQISQYTFNGCTGLTTVNLNEGLTTIGACAFQGCSGLSSVSIPTSVTSIGVQAFKNCTTLTTINLNSNVGVSDELFYGCSGLTNVVIPMGVTTVGNSVFYGCSNLTHISIPNSVTFIGTSAFYGCTSLQNLVLPDSLPYISNSLCQNCASLENVTIPSSVAYIQTNAFSGCSNLFSVTVPNSVLSIETNAFSNVCNVMYNGMATGAPWGAAYVNGYIQDSILYSDNTMTTLLRAHPHITTANIPSSVTTIGAGAFQNCTNLTSLTIGSNVQNIGSNAFSGCTGIRSLTIGNNVQVVGDYAFSNCVGLTNLTIGNNVQSIGQNAFANCTGLTNLTIGNNVQSIGQNAFQGCSGLTTLNYNASAIYSFQGFTSLTNVMIGSNVTQIANNMFNGCSGLTSISLPNTVQTIGQYAFYSTGITSIVIPSSCTSIGSYAFYGCPLGEVVVESVIPPNLGSSALSVNPLVYIPCGTYSTYYSMWYQYRNNLFEPTVEFVINVQASEGGLAYATSEISCVDSTATLSAQNDYGYHFDHWSDGNTDNPRTIHVTSDTTVTAIFARNSYTIALNSSDETLGSTNGGGTYLYGDTAVLVAIPVDHYHFLRWRTANYYGYETSIHENPYNVIVTNDMVLTADFAIDTYYVNVIPNEVTRGSVTGSGYAEYGQPITVSATPYSGYQFVRWSNGAEYNPYTFAVTNDMTLEAVFMEEGTVYHVEATSDNSVMGTVTGGGPYATGETAVLTAVAYPGYHFVRWQDNVTENPRSYLVTHDASFVAFFEPNVGIGEIEDDGVNVYVNGGRIIVENVNGMVVRVYDMMGRLVATASGETVSVPMPVGVYMVKVGTLPARKVVVIR